MSVGFMILGIVYICACITLILLILLQKKGSGLGSGVTGMGGDSQTYWDKNKGRSLEGSLERYTKLLGGAFMVLSLVMCLLR